MPTSNRLNLLLDPPPGSRALLENNPKWAIWRYMPP
jgi:hypothetical protein